MRFDILTLFPEVVETYAKTSIIGAAKEKGLVEINAVNLRDFGDGRHKTVDDTPYGGGAGMVMKIKPVAEAIASIKSQCPPLRHPELASPGSKEGSAGQANPNAQLRRIVVLSARGEQFTQKKAYEYSQLEQLILICGRYEGIDQRVADYLADEEISVGPYVLAGGELPALTIMEATARLVFGVLGNPESLREESHSKESQLEYPQYTKPEVFGEWEVPKVLMSGNHEEIRRWRQEQRLKIKEQNNGAT